MQLTALALWLNTAFAGFDEAVATAIHQLYVAAGWFFTPFLSFISLLGKGGIFLILLSIALMLFRKTRRYGTTMLLALAIGALVTNVCFKPLVARPRPYTHDGSIFQQYWEMLGKHTESDKSFPSGHMTAAMAASLAVFLRGNKKVSWTALLFALAMGVSQHLSQCALRYRRARRRDHRLDRAALPDTRSPTAFRRASIPPTSGTISIGSKRRDPAARAQAGAPRQLQRPNRATAAAVPL